MTDTIPLLDRLIGFETVSDQSNLALMDFVTDHLRGLGFRVTPLPAPCGDKTGLFAEIGPQGVGGVLLSAHTDVVPVAGQDWTRPPFRLTHEDSRLYGRGTTDMKGFVACMLSLATRAARRDLKEPLKLVLSYDEEVGCKGIAEMRGRLAPLLAAPRLCIVGEPTGMQVATGHKGKRAIAARFHGEAGHSALAPRHLNAVHLAADFLSRLRALQTELEESGARDPGFDIPFSTVHCGRLCGGTAVNIVPDTAEMDLEFRHIAADDPDAILARITRMARDLEATHPAAKITLHEKSAYPGLETPTGCHAARDVAGWADTGMTKVAFGTEAGTFHELGIPTVVCGPGSMSGQGHKRDEYVEEGQLTACDRMLDRMLADISASRV
jgi:acetylornithine deacetylase